MSKTIDYTVEIPTNPEKLFEVFLDATKHAEFSGAPSTINAKIGGKFTAYDGALSGEFTKIDANKEITQTWRARGWPEEHFSEVSYKFEAKGDKTILTFKQTDVPDEFYDNINEGWQNMYWNKLEEYFS